jgi:hypothetical protein
MTRTKHPATTPVWPWTRPDLYARRSPLKGPAAMLTHHALHLDYYTAPTVAPLLAAWRALHDAAGIDDDGNVRDREAFAAAQVADRLAYAEMDRLAREADDRADAERAERGTVST